MQLSRVVRADFRAVAGGHIPQGGLVYIDKRGQVAAMTNLNDVNLICAFCARWIRAVLAVYVPHAAGPLCTECALRYPTRTQVLGEAGSVQRRPSQAASSPGGLAPLAENVTRCPSCDSTAIARRDDSSPWHCPVCSWCRHELSAPPAPPRFAVGAWLRDATRPTDCGQVMSSSSEGDEPVYLVCCEGEDENFWVCERDAVEVQR